VQFFNEQLSSTAAWLHASSILALTSQIVDTAAHKCGCLLRPRASRGARFYLINH
jgi:hypothetical protein